MNYILLEDQVSIIYGPKPWNHRLIQSDVDNLEIDYKISPTEPNAYLKIADNLEVYPATIQEPSFNPLFQELSGPFWTFENQVASGTFEVKDRNIDWIKGDLKKLLAAERYKKEVAGFKLTIQNTEITVETDRETRNIFVQKYALMGDSEEVSWKFPEAWLNLSKGDLVTIIELGAAYIQGQFDWEKEIVNQIDAAITIDALKIIKESFLPEPTSVRK